MRIAFVMSRRDPALPSIDNDGGVVLLLGYGKALAALGHRVDIYTTRANTGWGIADYVIRKRSLQAENKVALVPGLNVIRKNVAPVTHNNFADHNSDLNVIRSSLIFADSFDDELTEYDFVNFFHPTSAYGLLAHRKVVVPKTILFPMLLSTEYAKFKDVTRHYLDMEIQVLKESGWIFSSSLSEEKQLAFLGVERKKMRSLSRGFDTGVFEFKKRSHPTAGRQLRIVSVGAIRPQKNQDMLVDVAIELEMRGIDARIIVVGENQSFAYAKNQGYYEWVKNRVEQANLQDKIVFVGGVSPYELSMILDDSDIALFPSMAESFGKAALETLASGIPTIAAENVEAYRMFMTSNVNSIMTKPSATGYADAVENLCRDPSLYASLSEQGAVMSERFSWNTVTKRLEALYLELM